MRRLLAAVICFAATAGLAACGDDAPAPSPESAETPGASAGAASSGEHTSADSGGGVLAGTLPLLNGEPQRLEEFHGEVVLVVNTASECGFAPQFEGLERLYDERRADGFVVLGFPADDVAGQEPRDNPGIAEFCEENFGVSFPMFAKSNVVDDPVNPLFERLAAEAGEPTYNFNKYLLDRQGAVIERFDQTVEPDDPALLTRIDALLAS